ncbi:l-ascorbate oxidase-like protein [Hordeum vulgare]|nr:l-ascorbate oxidase-like protein [Hordeum vulgare]
MHSRGVLLGQAQSTARASSAGHFVALEPLQVALLHVAHQMCELEKCAHSSLPTSRRVTAPRMRSKGQASGIRGHNGRSRGMARPRMHWHSDGMALEFVVELHGIPRGRLHLPRPFAREMEAAKPPVLWLRAYGCSHGAMQVHVEYPKRRSMLLGRGWKDFTRAHNLEDGHIFRFKVAEDNMPSVKFCGCSGVRLGCCEQTSSGAECPSSSDSDKEDSGGSGALGRSGSQGVMSEYDSSSSI